jgi:hypothetical protein
VHAWNGPHICNDVMYPHAAHPNSSSSTHWSYLTHTTRSHTVTRFHPKTQLFCCNLAKLYQHSNSRTFHVDRFVIVPHGYLNCLTCSLNRAHVYKAVQRSRPYSRRPTYAAAFVSFPVPYSVLQKPQRNANTMQYIRRSVTT